MSQNSSGSIIDTNVSRTIKRAEILKILFDKEEFVRGMGLRLLILQEEKEDLMNRDVVKLWLVKEAASTGAINEHSTLRASYENYLISKLSPLLGYLISIIDSYSNLDVYYSALASNQNWKIGLWLKILVNLELLEIKYDNIRNTNYRDENLDEKSQFMCKSDWLFNGIDNCLDEKTLFSPKLPFFWLLFKTFFINIFAQKLVSMLKF